MSLLNPDKEELIANWNDRTLDTICPEVFDVNPMFLHALNYWRHGFCVLPAYRFRKEPIYRWTDRIETKEINKLEFLEKIHLPNTEQMTRWFLFDCDRNILALAGNVSGGLVDFDFDGNRAKTLEERFLDAYPEFRQTLWVRTGGGSHHFWCYFESLPEDYTNSSMDFSKEFPRGPEDHSNHIEMRANRSIIVLPPSIHYSGRHYEFDNLDNIDPENPIIRIPYDRCRELLEKFSYKPRKRFDPELLKKFRKDKSWLQVNDLPTIMVAEKLKMMTDWDGYRSLSRCPSGHSSQRGKCFSIGGPKQNLWHCFSCGESGNNIKLVMMVKGIDMISAMTWLIREFRSELDEMDEMKEMNEEKSKVKERGNGNKDFQNQGFRE